MAIGHFGGSGRPRGPRRPQRKVGGLAPSEQSPRPEAIQTAKISDFHSLTNSRFFYPGPKCSHVARYLLLISVGGGVWGTAAPQPGGLGVWILPEQGRRCPQAPREGDNRYGFSRPNAIRQGCLLPGLRWHPGCPFCLLLGLRWHVGDAREVGTLVVPCRPPSLGAAVPHTPRLILRGGPVPRPLAWGAAAPKIPCSWTF
jgi:hypothetical protein